MRDYVWLARGAQAGDSNAGDYNELLSRIRFRCSISGMGPWINSAGVGLTRKDQFLVLEDSDGKGRVQLEECGLHIVPGTDSL